MTEETAILQYLSSHNVIENSYPWSESQRLDHEAVVGAVKSLQVDAYVVTEDLTLSYYTLTMEGQGIVEQGSHEILVLNALLEAESLSMPELQKKVGKSVAKVGMGNCMKNKWIKMDKGTLVPLVAAGQVQDTVQEALKALEEANGDADAVQVSLPLAPFLDCACVSHFAQ